MEQHPFDESAEGRGRALSRRDLLAATGGVVLAGGLVGNAGTAFAAGSAKPKRGGTFRLGVTGGGAKDFIDGQSIITKPDQARLTSGWETLLTFDRNYKLTTDGLAESAVQVSPKLWTDQASSRGSSSTTARRSPPTTSSTRCGGSLNPKNKLFGSAGLAAIDPTGLKKVDKLTVRMPLKTADSTIAEQLGQYYNGIVPVGYSRTNKLKWVGTGPFITQSFSPGRQSVHVRNPNYWQSGQPHFDSGQGDRLRRLLGAGQRAALGRRSTR